MTCRNGTVSSYVFPTRPLQPSWKLWYDGFEMWRDYVIKGNITDGLGTISSFPTSLVHISVLIIQKIGITKGHIYFTKESKNGYCKVITKNDGSLLQSVAGATKCERLLLQSVPVITKWDVTQALYHDFYKCYFSSRAHFAFNRSYLPAITPVSVKSKLEEQK